MIVVEEIARADAAAAWNLTLGASYGLWAAFLPEEVAREICGAPDAVVAGALRPSDRGRPGGRGRSAARTRAKAGSKLSPLPACSPVARPGEGAATGWTGFFHAATLTVLSRLPLSRCGPGS
jgi:hypothetical protein